VNDNTIDLWDAIPYIFADRNKCFASIFREVEACTLKMKASGSSKSFRYVTPCSTVITSRGYIPEDGSLNNYYCSHHSEFPALL
jgi:hypothetical protein